MTVTVCGALVPPGPVQVSVKVVVVVREPVVWVPEVAFVPLQPLLAVHDVALVEDHVSTAEPPDTTLGKLADSVAVAGGGGPAVTVAVALWLAVPRAPVQLRVNVVSEFSAAEVSVPEVAFEPLQPPLAVQDVTFTDDQVMVVVPPLVTDVGFTLIHTTGACTAVTVTLCVTLLPPAL